MNPNPKTVVVTGGAGFIGSATTKALLSRGDAVIVVDDFNNYYSPAQKRANLASVRAHPRLSVVAADIRQPGLFARIFTASKVDAVIHLAARAGVRPSLVHPELYWQVNVMGTLQLLQAMKTYQIPQLVFASSSSVYGDRTTTEPTPETAPTDRQIAPYGASKKAMELMCYEFAHTTGTPTTGLRFFTAYGPGNRPDMACSLFARAILTKQPITLYGDGVTARDYTYIDDIVSGILASLDQPMKYEIFNLGNSSPVSLGTLLSTLETVMGKTTHIIHAPLQEGDVHSTSADISKATQVLGWKPTTTLAEGLTNLVSWLKDNLQTSLENDQQSG